MHSRELRSRTLRFRVRVSVPTKGNSRHTRSSQPGFKDQVQKPYIQRLSAKALAHVLQRTCFLAASRVLVTHKHRRYNLWGCCDALGIAHKTPNCSPGVVWRIFSTLYIWIHIGTCVDCREVMRSINIMAPCASQLVFYMFLL